jgi:hypothetical protein
MAPAMLALAAPAARAQAWLPAQGDGAVSVLFQDVFVKYHSFTSTSDGHLVNTLTTAATSGLRACLST